MVHSCTEGVSYFPNIMGGTFSLLCFKDWLVNIPWPSFERAALHQIFPPPLLPLKAIWWSIFILTAASSCTRHRRKSQATFVRARVGLTRSEWALATKEARGPSLTGVSRTSRWLVETIPPQCRHTCRSSTKRGSHEKRWLASV